MKVKKKAIYNFISAFISDIFQLLLVFGNFHDIRIEPRQDIYQYYVLKIFVNCIQYVTRNSSGTD
jgi:hypothetical protein